jgi:sigma-B regulation protein RsbU (phosphoserine phosphatase)
VHYVNLREELAEKARIDHDLRVARDIQTGMLPKELPKVPGLEVAAFTQPAQEIGGDFYDFIPIDESHIGIVVADIAGKGVSGALLMAVCRSVLRARAIRISPADTLKGLNRVIAAEISEGMFACVLYMVYNTLTRELCIARAGMERPVVYSAGTGDMRLITTKGTPIGLMDRAVFESTLVETTIQLKPGDTVVAFTDGVIEAMNHENHEWGRENLYNAVREGVSQGAEGVLRLVRQRLDAHCGTRPQYDDITLLTLQSH